MKIILLTLLYVLSPYITYARTAKTVLIKTEFRNKNWFPLTKNEMKSAAVDTALEELTRSNLIEITKNKSDGVMNLTVVLVEKAATGKITITFTAKGLSSIVTTASTSLNNQKRDQIYKSLEQMGRTAGKKMKEQLIKVIPADEVDKKLDRLFGKDWDNFETEKLFNKAQELKRDHQFEEAKRLFVFVSKRSDKGSQQWKRLAADELIFRLPLFEANYLVSEATTNRKQVPINKVMRIYERMLKDNRSDELRVSQVQAAMDNLTYAKSMLSKAFQQALRGYIRNIQMSILMHYAESGKVPEFKEFQSRNSHMFRSVEISEYKILEKGKKYSFIITSKKTGAKAKVSGYPEDRGQTDIKFY